MLTTIPFPADPNARLLVGDGCLLYVVTGLNFNSTDTVTLPVDLFALAEQGYGHFTNGSLNGNGIEAAAIGTTFKLEMQVSNNTEGGWVARGSTTAAGGGNVCDLDMTGGFRYFRLKVNTVEGAACTGTAYFAATRTHTN